MAPFSVLGNISFRATVQLFFVIGGGVCTFFATWIFYLNPWLHFSAGFDPWLERNRCLVVAWCETKLLFAQPLGVLFVLGALGAFLWAMWLEYRLPLRWKAALDAHQLLCTRLTFLCITIGALIFQAVQLLYYTATPSGAIWLVGVVSLLAFGVTLDIQQAAWHRTLSNLTVGMGLMITLLGAAGLLLRVEDLLLAALLVGVGGVTLGIGSRWTAHLGSALTPTDHLLILLLALLHLVLALRHVWSWRFAFIGDEWGFFDVAVALNHSATDLHWFDLRDSNSFHTVLSMQFQAWVLRLYGENVAIWRLSAVLPAVFSVPGIYVLGHWLGGRATALLSAGVFATSHVLLTFAMIPYNNTQALFPLLIGMALFIFAVQRESSFRYLLLGMVLGLSFIVYGLARLAIIPVGIFWLFHPWPNLRLALRRAVEIGSGLVVVAAPILLNFHGWQALLKATPVQSEVAPTELALVSQILRNVLSGFLAFLTNPTNSHFVMGPYVDPLTAVFVLMGVSYLIIMIGRQRATTAWLIGSLLLLMAMSGIQQYDRIATTRMFSSVGIFALYAGLGGTILLKFLLPTSPRLQYGGIGVCCVALILINQYHIRHVTFPNSEKPNIALVVQQFQESAAADGRGMPIFVIENDPANSMLKSILQAYQIRQERIMLLTADEALTLRSVCAAGQAAAMLILPVTTAEGEAIRNHIADCWRNYAEVPLQNRASETVFYRFTSTVAQNTLAAAPLVQQHTRSAATHLSIEKAHALTVAPGGSLFVLVTAPPQVIHYSPQGQRLAAFSLSQKYPIALAIDDQERLIVAGGEQKLVWYDLKGQIIQETLARRDLARPFSLAVLAGGELIVSDIERRQLVRISAQGTLLAEINLPELVLPGALVLSADQESVWVYDAQAGSLLEISLQNHQLLRQISSPLTDPADIVALLLLPNQHFLQTSPHRRRLIETDAQGELIRIWSGFDQPAALAANSANQLFVLDRRLEQVHIVSTGYPVPFNAHARDAATTALQSSTAQRDQPQSPLSPLTPPTGERD